MTNITIIKILREAASLLRHEHDPAALRTVQINNRIYLPEEFIEFKRDLVEAGSNVRILFLEQQIKRSGLNDFVRQAEGAVLVFRKKESDFVPLLLSKEGKKLIAYELTDGEPLKTPLDSIPLDSLVPGTDHVFTTFILFPYESLVSEYSYDAEASPQPLSPVSRFFRLMSTEKKDILYILFYSILIGLTGLILPVGIQNTVELISGGVFFSSVYILIAAVILGVLFTGVLQIVQITLVEYLQRRVFTKAAFEFAFRIPRMKMEAILKHYAPELINRFFDVLTIQKGLPKLLIDLTSAAIQILFGLILLSLYHPLFIFFSFALVLILFLIFFFTGPNGLKSSISESKYKYKVAQWLEELARSMFSFKIAGNTELPLRRTDDTVNNYLKYRRAHFRVLITQYSFIVVFKTAVTAALLIMGTLLVVNREITLGQFVASEVIIILILNAVEKTITYMDVVYDLFTAVDKVAHVTDLPLERVGGIDFPRSFNGKGYAIDLKNLCYRFQDKESYVLKDLQLSIKPGERVCISGPGGGGKTTLTNLICGLYLQYEGIITINNYSLRDLDIRHLRNHIGKNISPEDLFDGTILDNLTLGNPERSVEHVVQALQKVHLADMINALPEGLNTHLVSAGKGMSSSFIHKLILARILVKNPSLIILNDFFAGLKRKEKIELLECVIGKDDPWTLVAVSNDPLIMAACDRLIIINNGMVQEQGTFQELLTKGSISNYIE